MGTKNKIHYKFHIYIYRYLYLYIHTYICSYYNGHPMILGERQGEARGGVGEGEGCEGSFNLSIVWMIEGREWGELFIYKFKKIRWKGGFFFVFLCADIQCNNERVYTKILAFAS